MERTTVNHNGVPHQKARQVLEGVDVVAQQSTTSADYYAFYNDDNCLSIIILWKNGKAQQYNCKSDWHHIMTHKDIFYKRAEEYSMTECEDPVLKSKLDRMSAEYVKDKKPFSTHIADEKAVSLELFIKIWGYKGKMLNFEALTRHEVARRELAAQHVEATFKGVDASFHAFHENDKLNIVILKKDGKAWRYVCNGTWDEIINQSEWFCRRTLDYVARTGLADDIKDVLGKKALAHMFQGKPLTAGIEKDDVITLDRFVQIWGKKGKYVEYHPVL